MQLIGWLAPQSGSEHYLYVYGWRLFVALIVIYLPCGFVLSLVLNSKLLSVSEFFVMLQTFISIFGAIAKSLNVCTLLGRLRATECLLDKLDMLLLSQADRLRVRKSVALCNRIVLVYSSVYVGYVATMFMAAIWAGKPPLMMYFVLFDWRNGAASFYIHLLFEFVMLIYAVLMGVADDTYNLLFLIIFRTHMAVLKQQLQLLRADPNKTEAQNYSQLVHCIVYHQSILRCCESIRPVISRTIFVQFVIIGSVLGLTLMTLLFVDNFWQCLPMIVSFMAILLQTFPFCYLCDLFVDDFKQLSNAVWATPWIDAEPRYKSTLRIFIQHVQRPIVFIAGGIFPISMKSNIHVAKFAFSVITILQQQNLAERFE
ncbi:odorant receptor 59b [Drosophila busckii]|uniref:odorant receptor 59b n=1 Tax=Drosophila busckii TaxID=30019 RepID=UPI001432D348|nr:odorant receptor 59b [Drosophila busckii]